MKQWPTFGQHIRGISIFLFIKTEKLPPTKVKGYDEKQIYGFMFHTVSLTRKQKIAVICAFH